MIKVVSCCPEKIKSKLICKGGKIIQSIEVRAPEKRKPPADKQKPAADKPAADKPADQKPPEEKPTALVPTPLTGYPAICPPGVWWKPCYEGHCGGPCHRGCGIPCQPPSYDGYVKLVPSYDGWPSGCRCKRSYGCRCEFFTEENPPCTIM